jgi:rhodanese-related sulfurtransferase
MDVSLISPLRLHDLHQSGEKLHVIDVRTPAEFQEVHATIARNAPLESLNCRELLAAHPTEQPLYVICRSGSRGRQACEKLLAAGGSKIINVEGGTLAWEQAGLPVVRGRKTISLERQVRIAAGFLALTGAVLTIVHPYWAILSGFIGAGLMFAGITDTCGMAMILARMPWNQVGDPSGRSASPGCESSGGTPCRT